MKQKLMIYLVFVLVFASCVFANPLDNVMDPFRNVDFGSFYENASSFIDAFLFLLIFMGLAKFVFSKTYKKSSKPIIVGVGLALTFAAAFFEYQYNVNLGMLGPFAVFLVILSVIFLLFTLFKTTTNDNTLSTAIAILVGYAILRTFEPVYVWMTQVPFMQVFCFPGVLP